MLMVKRMHKRTPLEKERILLDIQGLGVINESHEEDSN